MPYTPEGLERRVAFEDAAEADRVAARRAEQQRAAAEFLAECERQEAADREHGPRRRRRRGGESREQLRLERESRRGRHLRAFWRSLVSLLPGPLRRPLAAAARDLPPGPLSRVRARARKERGEVETDGYLVKTLPSCAWEGIFVQQTGRKTADVAALRSAGFMLWLQRIVVGSAWKMIVALRGEISTRSRCST